MSRARSPLGLLCRLWCPRSYSKASSAFRRSCSSATTNSASKIATDETSDINFRDISEKDFKPRKALLVRKVTRYEYERLYLKPEYNEEQLKDYIIAKGSDYEALCERHKEYFNSLNEIQVVLREKGIDYRVIHRYEFDKKLIDWADVIFTAGGDGTFLMAASNIKGRSKPIIGINTDPIRSVGILCLPHNISDNFGNVIDRILNGDFRWLLRQRIRLTVYGRDACVVPVDLHKQQMLYPEHRFWEHVGESEQSHHMSYNAADVQQPKVLPILALNEVFIGESLSARVSFYEMLVDNGVWQKQKSSGITVCPGTGSSSWYFSINHINQMTAREILRIAHKNHCCSNIDLSEATLQKVVHEFNTALVFSPFERKMAYSHRDPLSTGVFQVAVPRGFCQKLRIKSRMWDACIVVDGSLSFHFNDGAEVELNVYDEDALRCVQLDY